MSLLIIIKRNMKLFFKDKGLFFVSLVTPLVLLLLYTTFLGKVFKDAFTASIPNVEGVIKDPALIDSFISAQLVSSLLAVSCVTVAFCANAVMVSDKYTDSLKDFLVTPVNKGIMALGYYFATMLSALLICYIALALGLGYMAIVGWNLDPGAIPWLMLDVLLLVNFGTALSSIIHFFLKTQGHMSAVGTIVSAAYGFICGAYMPMSNFNEGLRNALSFLPGTYATSLLRYHSMSSILDKFKYPEEIANGILDSVDAHMYFFDKQVGNTAMYAILAGATVALILIYILMNILRKRSVK